MDNNKTKDLKLFLPEKPTIYNGVIFLSGSGTNAEKILEYIKKNKTNSWQPSVIITDAPKKSRANIIAEKYNIPLIEHDIKAFYKTRGEKRVTLLTDSGRKIRTQWTDELRKLLYPFKIDFGILAGFIPLTNITDSFPCLNIHPGDLTVEKNGKRLLVGLHTLPIETAILNNIPTLRSSVIVAQTYTGIGGEMDSGPILGISTSVDIDYMGCPLSELKEIVKKRPSKRPIGGFKDKLENIAVHNQKLLKNNGDWIVFPKVIDDFSKNKFAFNNEKQLFFLEKNHWKPIKTIVYGKNIKKIV